MKKIIIPRLLLAVFALALALAPAAHAAMVASAALASPHHATLADDAGAVDTSDAAAPTAVLSHCPDCANCSLWTILAGNLPVPVNAAAPPPLAPPATPWTRAIPPDRRPPRLTA